MIDTEGCIKGQVVESGMENKRERERDSSRHCVKLVPTLVLMSKVFFANVSLPH